MTTTVTLLSSSSRTQQPAPVPALTTAAIVASPESEAAWEYKFSAADAALLDEIQLGCFNYFWNEVGAGGCLAKDKTSDTVCSTAAVGFQLASLAIGVERGWITKESGRERALTVLRTLTARADNKKYGIYFHFVDERHGGQPDFSRTLYRYELTASTVDHAILQAGVMVAAVYFGGEVAEAARPIVEDADWTKMYDREAGYISMGWRASTDGGVKGPGQLIDSLWKHNSDEERLVAFLAVGAPTGHAVGPAVYYRLQRDVKQHGDLPPYVVSWNGSMFTYFFSHVWIDYRHLAADDPAQFGEAGPRVDWFENSRRATLTHRQRCIEESGRFRNLSENRWGLAPCEFKTDYMVAQVKPNVSNTDEWRGAIIPPYGAGAAIIFTPAESLAALREYRSLTAPDGKSLVWNAPEKGGYGFMDSFSLDPPHGHNVNSGHDQGPLLLAIENARTGLIWRLFMQHDAAKRAVERLKLQPREAEAPRKLRRAG
ncbi:MAG: glucoamylase family protein [Pirellulales bacterium]